MSVCRRLFFVSLYALHFRGRLSRHHCPNVTPYPPVCLPDPIVGEVGVALGRPNGSFLTIWGARGGRCPCGKRA